MNKGEEKKRVRLRKQKKIKVVDNQIKLQIHMHALESCFISSPHHQL